MNQKTTTTKHLNQNKMKYSKDLPDWLRKRYWGIFMQMTPKMRRFVYNNSFESMCKNGKWN